VDAKQSICVVGGA